MEAVSIELSMVERLSERLCGSPVNESWLDVTKSAGVESCVIFEALSADAGGVGAGRFFFGVAEGVCNRMA